MGFRFDKLSKIRREEGFRACAVFLVRDIYFRIFHRLAFPSWRREPTPPVPQLFERFVRFVSEQKTPKVLEIGARSVSDITRRASFPPHVSYTGLDILPGPNVDIVGDAHELTSVLATESYDGVFSFSVFEHLLMPWKVVLEINKVLKPGGLVFVATHPTWPPHELPWDFWRFQPNGFWSLFNNATGFEILDCVPFEPARLIPKGTTSLLGGTVKTACSLGVVAAARKIAPPDRRLSWPITVAEITKTSYPSRVTTFQMK